MKVKSYNTKEMISMAVENYGGYGINDIKEYLDNGGDENIETKNGQTMLTRSIYLGNSKLSKFLIKRGLLINKKGSKSLAIPILLAARNLRFETVMDLLVAGAKLTNSDKKIIINICNDQMNLNHDIIVCNMIINRIIGLKVRGR